jgi:aminopeptidase N
MKYYIFLFILLFFAAGQVSTAALRKKNRHTWESEYREEAKTTTADTAETYYDIKKLKFNLNVTDTSTYIVGDVTTWAVVTADSLPYYLFELDSTVVLDSAKFNGSSVSVISSGNLRKIHTSPALPVGRYFNAEIFYHGTPSASGGFFNALTHDVSAHGTHMVYSLSDPYAAKNWWPAKQDIDDKIDTVDMFVTVPAGVTDGSNGVLLGVDSVSRPGYSIFHWQTHYPIDYYLISIAVAKFAEYKSYVTLPGSTDSMLVQNFLIDTATFNPLYKNNVDSIGQIIQYYSTLFGRYPFWQEKYGICYTTLAGGMEHQTMTTIGVPYTYVIAHELCHQWFGDHVTYATWGDVWLSEGFATFSEQLFLDHFWGSAAALAHRQNYIVTATGTPCGSVYVSDTSGPSSIFSYTYVYAKAEAVVEMLRYIAPTDSLFFSVLKAYQQQYAFGNASTANLKAIADSVYSMNLDTFFNQWIYRQGYPQYNIRWNQIGSTVYVELIQVPSCPGSVSLFRTPVELKLHGTTADTIVKVYNNIDTQVFSFNWSVHMSSVVLNPDAVILCSSLAPFTHDATLGIGTANMPHNPTNIKVFPNPTENFWELKDLPDNADLKLTDKNGKLLWEGHSRKNYAEIPGAGLQPGNYFLSVQGTPQPDITLKLCKW